MMQINIAIQMITYICIMYFLWMKLNQFPTLITILDVAVREYIQITIENC